jgi:hypothetical protein
MTYALHIFETSAISLPNIDECEPMPLLYVSWGEWLLQQLMEYSRLGRDASEGSASPRTRSLEGPLTLNYLPVVCGRARGMLLGGSPQAISSKIWGDLSQCFWASRWPEGTDGPFWQNGWLQACRDWKLDALLQGSDSGHDRLDSSHSLNDEE